MGSTPTGATNISLTIKKNKTIEVTLKQAALVSVNDGTIIIKKNGKNYTYNNASVKSVVGGNITIEISNPYKKGDYLRVRIFGDIWVTLVYKKYDPYKSSLHFFVSENSGGYRHNDNWLRDLISESEDVRYCTPKEIIDFHDFLHSNGKHWNAKTLQLEDYFWKPRLKQMYYYITSSVEIAVTTNDGCIVDKDMIAIDNCFQTEKEAEPYLDKFKEIFKR